MQIIKTDDVRPIGEVVERLLILFEIVVCTDRPLDNLPLLNFQMTGLEMIILDLDRNISLVFRYLLHLLIKWTIMKVECLLKILE